MRKQLLTALAAGAVVLAGCARIETTEVPEGRVISFDNHVNNVVKAIDGEAGLTSFFVYGATDASNKVFNNTEVKTDGNSGWAYDTTRYWQIGNPYKFAAYSNDNERLAKGVTFTYNETDKSYLTIEYTAADGNKDLIYSVSAKDSYTYTEGDDMESVQFTFYHILSNIELVFTKDETLNNHDLTIKDVKVKACTTATFTGNAIASTQSQYSYSNWSAHGSEITDAYQYVDATGQTISGKTTDAGGVTPVKVNKFLIPQNASNLTVSFTIVRKGMNADGSETDTDETYKFENVSLSLGDQNDLGWEWDPGFHYVYTATISADNLGLEPIVFDVDAVEGWSNEDSESSLPIDTSNGINQSAN